VNRSNLALAAVGLGFAVIVAPTCQAQLSLPTIPVHVEGGLDAGTQALLQNLPPKIHQEIVAAVKESLDRADLSVATYINEIQSAVADSAQNISCLALADAKNLGEALLNNLRKLASGGWANITPPEQSLLNAILTGQQNIHGDTPTCRYTLNILT
jgi:hypothetical protein